MTDVRLSRWVLAAVVVGACGDNQSSTEHDGPPAADAQVRADAAIDAAIDAAPDAKVTAACEAYPIPWVADAGAQAAAMAELATIAPGATLSWNDNTGTLSSVFQLDLPLGCTTGNDVNQLVVGFLTAHPALFQLDASEWDVAPEFQCQFVPTDLQILSMGRRRLANHALARDVLAYSIASNGTDVELRSVIATYVPPAIDGLDEAMTACADLGPGAVEAIVRSAELPAQTYDQCAPTGSVTYTLQAGDTVAELGADTWSWEEGAGQVVLTGTRTVRVTLDPANYTPELLASDARCPVTDPTSDDFTVGFDVTLDVHTGEILFVKPGLDCVVC